MVEGYAILFCYLSHRKTKGRGRLATRKNIKDDNKNGKTSITGTFISERQRSSLRWDIENIS